MDDVLTCYQPWSSLDLAELIFVGCKLETLVLRSTESASCATLPSFCQSFGEATLESCFEGLVECLFCLSLVSHRTIGLCQDH